MQEFNQVPDRETVRLLSSVAAPPHTFEEAWWVDILVRGRLPANVDYAPNMITARELYAALDRTYQQGEHYRRVFQVGRLLRRVAPGLYTHREAGETIFTLPPLRLCRAMFGMTSRLTNWRPALRVNTVELPRVPRWDMRDGGWV